MEGMGFGVLGRPGGDRLSRVLRHSTMGAGVFNGRVREGIGFWARRSSHQAGAAHCWGSASVLQRLGCVWSDRDVVCSGHGSWERSSRSGD